MPNEGQIKTLSELIHPENKYNNRQGTNGTDERKPTKKELSY